jgi:hypothetical protein
MRPEKYQGGKEDPAMCMSCGCKQPNEDHGDDRNITMDALQQAADAAGISVDEAASNIVESAGDRTTAGVGQTAADGQRGQ